MCICIIGFKFGYKNDCVRRYAGSVHFTIGLLITDAIKNKVVSSKV